MATHPPANRHLKLAACAVAFAAAMGGSTASASELHAIQKIEHYCTASWRNAGIQHQEWTDCTQQALLELLERVSRDGLAEAIENNESEQRRELNRTVWRTIQRWRRSTRPASLEEAQVADHRVSLCSEEDSDAWDQVLAVAAKCLSERQQSILQLTREGWRVAEIAEEMQIPAARVSDLKYKAIVKLQSQLGAV